MSNRKPVRVTWTPPVSRQFGTPALRIPRKPRWMFLQSSELVLNKLPLENRYTGWELLCRLSILEERGRPKELWERLKPVLSINDHRPNVAPTLPSCIWEDWYRTGNVKVVGYVS